MRAWAMALCLAVAACGDSETPGQSTLPGEGRAPQVYAVNYPLAWAADQLAGGAAEIHFPAPAGIDPAFWTPELNVVAAYQSADLILLNGAGYAGWVDRVSLPQNRMLDTSAAFKDRFISVDNGPRHSHGPQGEHSHGELAFTLWLDLDQYSRQVEAIAAGLTTLLPAQAEAIAERRDLLAEQLQLLDREFASLGQQLGGAPVLYSHPVYQYFERRYELNGVSLHWEPEQVPGESEWAALDSLLQAHPALIMLWEDEPAAATRAALEQRGIIAITLRPLGNPDPETDLLEAMQTDLRRFAEAVSAHQESH